MFGGMPSQSVRQLKERLSNLRNTKSKQAQQPPAIRFASEIQQMKDMGFYDEVANARGIAAWPSIDLIDIDHFSS